MSEASWQPDPTGRHQYRWFDGAAWTDNVSDNGQTSTDPYSGAAATVYGGAPAAPTAGSAPAAPAWQTPAAAAPAGGAPAAPAWETPAAPAGNPAAPAWQTPGTPAGGPAAPAWQNATASATGGLQLPQTPAAKKSNPLKWILPLVAVAALAIVGFVVLGGGDDDGGSAGAFGISEHSLADEDQIFTRTITLKRGEAIRVRVEPGRRLDAVLGVLVDEEVDEESIDVFNDLFDADIEPVDANDVFDGDLGEFDDFRQYLSVDGQSAGEVEAFYFTALVDGDYTIAVGAVDSDGDFRLIVEKHDEVAGDDAFEDLDEFTDFQDDRFFEEDDFFFNDEPYGEEDNDNES